MAIHRLPSHAQAVKILFVGSTWKGSSARSLREVLAGMPTLDIDEIGEDHYTPVGRSLVIRSANRLLGPLYRRELSREIRGRISVFRPTALMVYKGSEVSSDDVRHARRMGVLTVCVFPDYSPHAYGAALKEAIGEYDLVISTKPFHPGGWQTIYGYRNQCVFVPHGYDPQVHLWDSPPTSQDIDVVLAATWRPQYDEIMRDVAARMRSTEIRFGIIGHGWAERARDYPANWELAAPQSGRAYGDWLRRGRIAIAPVNHRVVIKGVVQPGDEDTTRTYELAAMGCFFLHYRTPFARTLYDESTEVPMWSNATELASLIAQYLPLETERRTMAARAHARAVPAYSIPSRAGEVMEHVWNALRDRGASELR